MRPQIPEIDIRTLALKPLSTFGIGSVPFVPGKNSCLSIFQNWDIPFWPQYPARSWREQMIFQFLDPQLSAESARGYAEMKAILSRNLFPQKQIIKLQVTGLETVWKSLFEKHVPAQHAIRVREILENRLIASGHAQINFVRSFGRKALVFIDEPLYGGNPVYLKKMVAEFKKKAAVGLHLCSNPDWQGLDRLCLNVFHFDCSILYEKSGVREKSRRLNWLRARLIEGKWIAWGLAPTFSKYSPTVKDFSQHCLGLICQIAAKGLKIQKILGQSLLAPACGTGLLTVKEAETILKSLQATRDQIKETVAVKN